MRFLALALTALLVGPAHRVESTGRIARLYIYTDQHIRPRHRAIVTKALLKRAKTHTSVFAEKDGAPLLQLGPVTSLAKKWKPKKKGWAMEQATTSWPFVAVLEYDGTGKPEALVDWFRRAKNSEDGSAWHCDPAAHIYAEHISKQTVCDRDARYAYMALVDTPSGEYPKNSEWLIRARVTWQNDPKPKRTGWWLRFQTPKSKPWHAVLLPLVDWTIRKTKGKRRDIAASRRLLNENELGVFGTKTVFSLPPIPPTVVPCRGF